MESKTPPNNLSDTDLLDILNKTSAEEKELIKIEDSSNDDILEFISFYRIESGEHFVSHHLISKLYCNWSKTPYKVSQFHKIFAFYFPRYKNGLTWGYLLNTDTLNISKQLFNFLNKSKFNKKSNTLNLNNFIKKFDIKPGNFRIDKENLYYLYTNWLIRSKKNIQLQIVFLGFMKSFLKYELIEDRLYFLIDECMFNYITKEEVNKIKKGKLVRNEKEKKRNKTT